jgi:hypothetical protein
VHDWIDAGTNATGYSYTFVPADKNHITRLNEKSCSLYGTVHDGVKASQSWIDARKYYYTTYNQKLANLVEVQDKNISQDYFDDSCEYLFFS